MESDIGSGAHGSCFRVSGQSSVVCEVVWWFSMSAVAGHGQCQLLAFQLFLQAANTTLLLTFGFKYFSIRCCPHSFLFSSGATSYPACREQTV